MVGCHYSPGWWWMKGRLASASVRRYRGLPAAGVVNKGDAAQVVEAVLQCCAKEPLAKVSVY